MNLATVEVAVYITNFPNNGDAISCKASLGHVKIVRVPVAAAGVETLIGGALADATQFWFLGRRGHALG